MRLTPGTRLGVYEVTAQIGEGGMGQVYRATDTKLKRQVAIKILPPSLAADHDRLARFQREAEVLASLNHPHIAAIHGLEDADGVKALVMELVEGDDLSQRLARGPIPLDEALPIAKQIAEALEAAHEQGIIHRDLKPANIKVRPDGTVKVLDFGLAKAMEPVSTMSPDLAMSPTITTPAMTQAGVILGTAAYMSPEQARGKVVDKRSDIWAFGCVVYEMLTGRRAFDGNDVMETLAAVLTKEPDWKALPSGVTATIRRLLHRCLEKDPRKRLHDIADARLEIDELLAAPPKGEDAREIAPAPSKRRQVLFVAVGIIAVTILIAIVAVWDRAPSPSAPVARFVVGTSATEPLVSSWAAALRAERHLAISPDGKRIVYVAGGSLAPNVTTGTRGFHLYTRYLDRLEGHSLTSLQPQRIGNPFVSPDGTWVGYATLSDATWKRVPIAGGPSETLFKLTGDPRGASWGVDNRIIFATATPATGLFRSRATGGDPDVLTTPKANDGELNHWWPEILPGGRAVLYTVVKGPGASNMDIALLDLESGKRTRLISGGGDPHYAGTGHIVYNVDGALRAVRFDLDRMEVTGDSVQVLEQVVNLAEGAAEFALAPDGSLVYRPATAGDAGVLLTFVDRAGRQEPIAAPPRLYAEPAISPDGTRVAVTLLDSTNSSDIWVWNLPRGPLTRLTTSAAREGAALWTPDGARVVFSNGQGTLLWKAADNTGAVETLIEQKNRIGAVSWSKDGQLLFHELAGPSNWDIGLLSVERRSKSMLLSEGFGEARPAISPDGRWLAYESNESGPF